MSLRRRQLLGLAAAGLLPAACSKSGTQAAQPASGTGVGATAPPSAVQTPGTTWPWAGRGVVPATPGRALLGAYLGLSGKSQDASLKLRREQLGRDEKIVHYFYGWRDDLPDAYPGLAPGAVPMVSWRGSAYGDINNGSSDDLIKANARALKRYGKPVLLRWAWEMNGDWYVWGGARNGKDTAGFVTAWRRLHRIFGEVGADQVSWVWGPNWNSAPAEGWNHLDRYYPGDEYVDWVGCSGYPHGGETPERLFGELYRAYTPRKPMMIAEVAAIDKGGRTKPDWITMLDAWVDAHPAVGAMVWFDTDTHPWTTENFRIDSSAEALAAYRTLARDPRFAA